MSRDRFDLYKDKAEKARSDNDFDEAGRYYTLAAYEGFGECNYQNPEQITTGTFLGLGIYCLQQAAITYRVAGKKSRGRNRALQGILIAKDFRDESFVDPALKGLADEWIGDFRTIGGLHDADLMYGHAVTKYDTVDDPRGWLGETIFEWSLETFLEVANAAEHPIPVEVQIDMHESFAKRIDFKRSWFAENVEDVVEQRTYPLL